MPDKLSKLKEMMQLLNEGLTKTEFVSYFKQVLKIVKDIKDTNSVEFKSMQAFLKQMSDKMMSEISSEMSKSEKKMMSDCMQMMDTMMREHEVKMKAMDKKARQIDEKMEAVMDGKDADEEKIVKDVLTKIPPAPFLTSIEIRDRLEILPEGEKLSIQAIQDLSKMLDEMGQRITSSRSGASLISKRIRFIDDETPSGTVNGSNTIFTLTSKSPEAGSLKVYVNGSRMRVTEDYTLSDRTITFVTAPPTGSIILCDYRW